MLLFHCRPHSTLLQQHCRDLLVQTAATRPVTQRSSKVVQFPAGPFQGLIRVVKFEKMGPSPSRPSDPPQTAEDVVVHLSRSTSAPGGAKYLETAVTGLQLQLRSYGTNLKSFTNGMSELSHLAKDPHPKFEKLRLKVNQLAVSYASGPLERAIIVVQDLTTYGQTYTSLDLRTFKRQIQTIANMVAKYKKKIDDVAAEHRETARQSKELQREAGTATKELIEEVKVLETRATAMAAKVDHHAAKEHRADNAGKAGSAVGGAAMACAGAVAAVVPPVAIGVAAAGAVSLAVAGVMELKAKHHNEKQAKYQKEHSGSIKQARDAHEAAQLIENQLVQYISSFSNALTQLSACFTVLASDVQRFGDLANTSQQSPEDEDMMELHYHLMKGIAEELVRNCRVLTAGIYEARDSLKALPKVGGQNSNAARLTN